MTASGRLLRTLRSARAMTVEATSAGADMPPARLRALERGDRALEYLEGIRLAKSLDLCPNCFRRLFEAAVERDAVVQAEELEPAQPTQSADAGRPPGRGEVTAPIGSLLDGSRRAVDRARAARTAS